MKQIQPEIKKESEWMKLWCHKVEPRRCIGTMCTAWITTRENDKKEKYGVCGDLLR